MIKFKYVPSMRSFDNEIVFCFLGYWSPNQNIFSLVDELGIRPFTNWTASAHYSGEGLEVITLLLLSCCLNQLPKLMKTLFADIFPWFLIYCIAKLSLQFRCFLYEPFCSRMVWKTYSIQFSSNNFTEFEMSGLKIVLTKPRFLQVEFPVFKDLPQLPTPLGTLFYTQVCLTLQPSYFFPICWKSIFNLVYINHCCIVQFARLPLVDRLTSLPLGAAGTGSTAYC